MGSNVNNAGQVEQYHNNWLNDVKLDVKRYVNNKKVRYIVSNSGIGSE